MIRGLLLGKFMPIHKGHIQLIEYAQGKCDELVVWICVSDKEPVSADVRFNWVKEIFEHNSRIKPVLFNYNEEDLPNTSESSMEVSGLWADAIKINLPKIDIIFSGEPYGEFIAGFLDIKHDGITRGKGISASMIRSNPVLNWDVIPDVVKPYYYKKVAILGTESTGKTVLTRSLANYFMGDYVAEAGRDIVEFSCECTWEDLMKISREHARNIIKKQSLLNKILIIDTDISITQSYARFLFNRELEVNQEIINANCCDLYLYLWNDCPLIQDGTRFDQEQRDRLHDSHLKQLELNSIDYKIIKGDWQNRFFKALEYINDLYKLD